MSFLVSVVLAFCNGFAQELPPVACPDKFAYLKLNDRYMAQVSVVLNASSQNNVKVELTVRGVSALNSVGEIKLSDSEPTVRKKLRKNEKLNFQMDLSPTDVLPKVLRIIVNGETICQAEPYDHPFTLATRILHLHTKNPLPAQDKADILDI